ncbi:MAG: hypothetical protein LBE24_03565 [Methylobacillus sp.]|jgi:hypothetical protein|nr:hypothetical protein [Methylobacillus sp.]
MPSTVEIRKKSSAILATGIFAIAVPFIGILLTIFFQVFNIQYFITAIPLLILGAVFIKIALAQKSKPTLVFKQENFYIRPSSSSQPDWVVDVFYREVTKVQLADERWITILYDEIRDADPKPKFLQIDLNLFTILDRKRCLEELHARLPETVFSADINTKALA